MKGSIQTEPLRAYYYALVTLMKSSKVSSVMSLTHSLSDNAFFRCL